MANWEHGGGFSVDAQVRIEAHERDGLERLLRYCARPAFALERLRELDPEHLVYESVKPGPGGSVSLMLTPMQLLDRLAALIPPPRRHRHRYVGVLAPNSPLRAAVTALAQSAGQGNAPPSCRCRQAHWADLATRHTDRRTAASPSGALCLGATARPHL